MTNTAAAGARPRTMALQGVANAIVRRLIATPVIGNGIGRRLLTIHAVGRKTGKRYSVPVAYTPHEGKLLVGTGFGWSRNLRTGEPVDIDFKGRKVTCDVDVFTGEEDVTRLYAVICRGNKNFAGFNKIRLGPDGEPNPDDLRAAWQGGARAFLLAPR
jgi:deazaflavin-dependent oxidoreductase (nitroreductase family)